MRQNQSRHTKDPYKVLGIDRTAKPREVRAAYVAAAKLYHTDINAAEGADAVLLNEKLRDVIEAYKQIKEERALDPHGMEHTPEIRTKKKQQTGGREQKSQPWAPYEEWKRHEAEIYAMSSDEGQALLRKRDRKLSLVYKFRSAAQIGIGATCATALILQISSIAFYTLVPGVGLPMIFGYGAYLGATLLAGTIGAAVASHVVEGQRLKIHAQYLNLKDKFRATARTMIGGSERMQTAPILLTQNPHATLRLSAPPSA